MGGDVVPVQFHIVSGDRQNTAVGHRIAGFTARLTIRCSICMTSAMTMCRSSASLVSILIRSPSRRRNIGSRVLDDLGEVHGCIGEHLFPAERQQLAGERGGAVRGSPNLTEVLPDRLVRADLVDQELGIAENRGEHVVEIMRHAARQPADGFHLLGVTQLLFELLPLDTQ